MAVYWLLFLVIILIQLIPVEVNKGNEAKLIISFLLMFFYAAIRIDYGNDYEAYKDIFYYYRNNYDVWDFDSRIEFGYIWLNMIVPTYRILLVTLSAFTCFTYYWLFREFIPPKYYWLGFVLLAISGDKMLFFQLSGLRNAIAINIMTLSIPLIIKRKIVPYFSLTVLAYFFHNSVVFFMPLAYFVATPNRFTKVNMIIWSSFTMILFIVSATFLIKIIEPYLSTYFEKYSTYLIYASDVKHTAGVFLYGFVLSISIISFNIMRKENLTKEDNTIMKLSLLFVISLILGVLNFRMSQYFAPYLIVGVISAMRLKEPILKYSYLGIVLLFLLYSFFIVFMQNPRFSFSVYHTIFS